MSWRDEFEVGVPRTVTPEEFIAHKDELSDEEKIFGMCAVSWMKTRRDVRTLGVRCEGQDLITFGPATKDELFFKLDERGGIRQVSAVEASKAPRRLLPMLAVLSGKACSACGRRFTPGDLVFAVNVEGVKHHYCPMHVRRALTRPHPFAYGFYAADFIDEADPVMAIKIARNADSAAHIVDDLVKRYVAKYETKDEENLRTYVSMNKQVLAFVRDRIRSLSSS